MTVTIKFKDVMITYYITLQSFYWTVIVYARFCYDVYILIYIAWLPNEIKCDRKKAQFNFLYQ